MRTHFKTWGTSIVLLAAILFVAGLSTGYAESPKRGETSSPGTANFHRILITLFSQVPRPPYRDRTFLPRWSKPT